MRLPTLLLVASVAACSSGSAPGSGLQPTPLWPSVPLPEVREPEPVTAINVQPPGPDEAARVLEALQELRIQHIRSSWWPWSDSITWRWLPIYRDAGVEVLPLVYPRPGHVETAGVSMAGRYRELVTAFGRFPYVQLGNEVDGAGPFGIDGGRDPYQQGVRWGLQLAIATRLIREFDPVVQVVTGGIAWNRQGVPDFVRGMIAVGGFDILAIHTYGVHVYGEPLSRYQTVRSQGWAGPIWATEWGVSRTEAAYAGVDPDAWQLENWRAVLSSDSARWGYQRLYGFQLTPDGEGWGILSEDWQARPAYLWLRGYQEAE